MKKFLILLAVFAMFIPIGGWAQDSSGYPVVNWELTLNPASAGFRFDDNVYRTPLDSGRLADGIVSGDWGCVATASYDIFKAHLGYHLGDDQYLNYTELNNAKNDIDLLFALEPAEWNFYYKFNYFIRDSQYYDFNYFDVNNVLGVRWTPMGAYTYEVQYENLTRQYFDMDPSVWSKNFVDQSGSLSVQREIDDRFSLKLLGSYTNREFNRYAVADNGGAFSSVANLQNDNTWKVLLNAHVYFASILQDINVEGQRTDSNSYGFSNWVESFSWAGVVRPMSGFYLQLFFRLYLKYYDQSPLNLPDLQLGFIDEDSQDLLAVKANWDLDSNWVGSLGVSRIRSESDQPNAYYIKDIISAQMRRSF
jgi:hypothetical protein